VRAVPRLFDGFQPPHDFGKARFVERRADHNRRPARAARKHGHHLMAIERGGGQKEWRRGKSRRGRAHAQNSRSRNKGEMIGLKKKGEGAKIQSARPPGVKG
jgi:hypothetical protein